jgi:hypothetical protein
MRILRIVLLLTAIIVIVLTAAGCWLYRQLPDMLTSRVQNELTTLLNRHTATLYLVEVEKAEITNGLSSVHLPAIRIIPQHDVIEMTADSLLPPRVIHAEFNNIDISMDGIISLARNRSPVNFSRFITGSIMLTIFNNPEGSSLPSSGEPIDISIDGFIIEHANLEYRLLADTSVLLANIHDISLHTHLAYSSMNEESTANLHLEGYRLQIGNIGMFPAESLYTFSIAGIQLEEDDNNLRLMDVVIEPVYGKSEMQQYLAFQTDRTDARFENVTVTLTGLNDIINHRRFISSNIVIKNGAADIFRDRNLPLDTLRRPKMPSRLIMEAGFSMFVSRVELSGIQAVYAERPEGQDFSHQGRVPITNINAIISNITNIPDSLGKDSILVIDASAMLFEKATLNAEFIYNLQDLNGGFRARGKLVEFDFEEINQALFPLSGIKVTKGKHQHTQFWFTGNNTSVSGEMQMHYSNLTLQIGENGGRLRRGIIRVVGQNLVYHPSNPGPRNRERTGEINFERDITRFVIHYWWQSFLSGVVDTVVRDHIPL